MSTVTLAPRQVAPSSEKFGFRFVEKAEPTPQEEFAKAVPQYLGEVAEFESESKIHVYDNPDADQPEYMMHCAWLAHLIMTGQMLLLYAHREGLESIEPSAIKLVQEKIDFCIARLHDWHGNPAHMTDIPESFKKAMADVQRGETVPFDI